MKIRLIQFIAASIIMLLFQHCKSDIKPLKTVEQQLVDIGKKEDLTKKEVEKSEENLTNTEITQPVNEEKKSEDKSAAQFQELTDADGVEIDLRYATKNNFTNKKIYDCARCYLRPEAAENLIKAQEELQKKYGYRFKLFDCFRPRPYQQRLWDIVPDADYVTPPAKGSMHSKGLAVDLTLLDKNGKELDMGTPFDFFGEEAHYSYPHSDDIKRNRWILKSTLEKYGFGGIRTEWWHFSYRKATYPLDEWVWQCH